MPAANTGAAKNSLPDLDYPATSINSNNNTTSIRPGPSGVTIESQFKRTKISITPEYSNQTGSSLGVTLASMLGDNAAIGVILQAGSAKNEVLINAGYRLDERQRFILTVGQLEQFLDYAFPTGSEKVGMTQNSGALNYQLQLGSEFLRFLEVNGYLAQTASKPSGVGLWRCDRWLLRDGNTMFLVAACARSMRARGGFSADFSSFHDASPTGGTKSISRTFQLTIIDRA